MERSYVLRAAFAIAATMIPLCSAVVAAEIHVSPSGSDANPGTLERPIQTLAAAQLAARPLAAKGPVRVILHGGVYYLPQPLVFTAADSGTAEAPVTYAAAPSVQVILSGGVPLRLTWKPHQGDIYRATTPTGLEIDQLFVDGRQQRMARYPNFDPNVAIYNGYAADAFSKQRAANWKNPIGGYIHAMHRAHWGGYHYLITGRNQAGEPTYEGGWQNNRQMGMHDSHRFVENVFEELDSPGEWYHDVNTSTLYFYPPRDVVIHAATVEVVRLRHLLEFRGSQEAPVKFVNLQGVIFRHAARTFMDTREPLLRSDWTIYRGGAVLYEGAEDCELAGCTFDQVGGNTIFLSNYNRRIAIRGCLISDSGASGVSFVGNPAAVRSPLFEYGERQAIDQIDLTPGPKSDEYPADCLVEDCLIRNTGRVEKQSAGVQISMARRITVRHCSIYGLPRAGINISEGTWGGHLIEHCDVFDTVLETGDHGSFNCWGRDRFWGLRDAAADKLPELALLDAGETTVIRNSRWRCDHGWDIDLDDGASNYHVYNNLMLHGGLKFREGFHRIAENNIMVGNSFHPHVWYVGSGDVFRRNIVFTQYRPIQVSAPWGKQVDDNLLHAAGVQEPRPAAFLASQSGRDEHSITADALFVDASQGDYRVREGSPALALGFENFAMDRFGVQSPRLRAIAQTPKLPEVAANESPPSSDMAMDTWNGALVRPLEGEAYSAFGVSREDGGIHLVRVPPGSRAARAGLQTNDVVQKIDGQPVRNMEQLKASPQPAAGKPIRIDYVREQQTAHLNMTAGDGKDPIKQLEAKQ